MQLKTNLLVNSETNYIVDERWFWQENSKIIKDMPKPTDELLPGICWGDFGRLYTPAFWKIQYLLHSQNGTFDINYKLGNNVIEEIVACLLGGFGMKSELGLAAFHRLKIRGLITNNVEHIDILDSLTEPFLIEGKALRYRFPSQKAKFIHKFLKREDLKFIPLDNDLRFRDWLLTINGIGPKTASWITRNFLKSENVAIIDVHIYRAGLIIGIFDRLSDIQRDYFKLEKKFLNFCKLIDVKPSNMDSLMWLQMKQSNNLALKIV